MVKLWIVTLAQLRTHISKPQSIHSSCSCKQKKKDAMNSIHSSFLILQDIFNRERRNGFNAANPPKKCLAQIAGQVNQIRPPTADAQSAVLESGITIALNSPHSTLHAAILRPPRLLTRDIQALRRLHRQIVLFPWG